MVLGRFSSGLRLRSSSFFGRGLSVCSILSSLLIGKEPAGERANGVLRGSALPADAVLESVLEAVLRCHMRVDARPMLGSRDAEAGQAGRPGVFVQLLDDVKDQGIGLLHGVPGFLQHALDYNMPAGFCRLRLAGPPPP